ncbi:transcriptional regulator, LacI family [Roseivivax sediminis]|uniref:Transcriptional regulator, LacI family n=2 Tax=Roseivivax sediminis TaxID=936889 RepID=A0A1I1SZU0_9RHOB|nr:transcriptional regulator, LacI family [Roseivivax sediminis]
MATLKDVARLAGVGSGTVSRYVSGNGSVSPKSAEKIARAITQLKYRPNSIARSLSSRRSDLLGVWVPSLEGPYYQMMIRAIELELRQQGKHMILANAEDAQTDEDRLGHIDYLINRDCDGILMSGSRLGEFKLASLSERYPNLVCINREVEALPGRAFSIDHDLGGRLAARHLHGLGHRKIAVITGRLSAQDAKQRHGGFVDEMARLGDPVAPERIIEGAFSYAGGERAADMLLRSSAKFTAVFCGNDKVAMVVASRLQASGVSVPDEVSVLGYDNVDFAEYMVPALSTIHAPIVEMTQSACRQLLNLTYGLDLPFRERFEPALCARKSTAPPPSAP